VTDDDPTMPSPPPTAPTPGRGEPTEGGIAVSPSEQLPRGLDRLVGISVEAGDYLARARAAENSISDISGISDGANSSVANIPAEQAPKRKRGRPRKEINSGQHAGEQSTGTEITRASGPAGASQPVTGTGARWTVTQKRVWHCETSPNWRFLSIDEKAKRAKVSKRQYYRVLADKAFQDELVSYWRTALLSDAANVSQAVVHNALTQMGREGYKDRELFFRASGLLPDMKISVGGKVDGTVTHQVGSTVADALRRARSVEAQDVGNRVIDVTPSKPDAG